MALIESGGRVVQETRLYNPDLGETFSMRSKEDAHDYRYFPEPDLVPLRISDAWLGRIRRAMPELPADKRARFIDEMGLSRVRCRCADRVARRQRVFRDRGARVRAAEDGGQLGDGRSDGRAQGEGKEIADSPVTAENLGELVKLIAFGRTFGQAGEGDLPEDVRHRRGARASSWNAVRHERHRSRHALGRGLQPILAAGREQHGHAPAGETLGQREADAGRAARDERNRTLPLGHARCAPAEPTRGTRRFAETLATSPGASPWIAAGSR